MLDRRRLARTITFVVAALAVAGTSAATPPTTKQLLSVTGTVHVSAEEPFAIVPVDVQVESGQLNWVEFSGTVNAGDGSKVVGAVVPGTAAGQTTSARPNGPWSVTGTGNFSGTIGSPCQGLPCTVSSMLVVTWADPSTAGATDVTWSLAATAIFPGTNGTPLPTTGSARLVAGTPLAGSAIARTMAEGRSGTLTEADRFRAWAVTLHRDGRDPHAGAAASFVTIRGSGRRTADPPAVPADRKDRRIGNPDLAGAQVRVAVDGRLVGSIPIDGTSATFDPFGACSVAEACDASFVVELAWSDGRPETAYEAAWALDLVSAAVSGDAAPVSVKVAPIEAPKTAEATSAGSLMVMPTDRPVTSRIVARLDGLPAGSAWPDGLTPIRGLVHARVTVVEGTPPPDIELLIGLSPQRTSGGADASGQIGLRAGEDGTFAVEPQRSCATDLRPTCAFDLTLSALPGGTLPPGVVLRVDWTLELEAGTGSGAIQVDVDPTPTPPATARP